MPIRWTVHLGAAADAIEFVVLNEPSSPIESRDWKEDPSYEIALSDGSRRVVFSRTLLDALPFYEREIAQILDAGDSIHVVLTIKDDNPLPDIAQCPVQQLDPFTTGEQILPVLFYSI